MQSFLVPCQNLLSINVSKSCLVLPLKSALQPPLAASSSSKFQNFSTHWVKMYCLLSVLKWPLFSFIECSLIHAVRTGAAINSDCPLLLLFCKFSLYPHAALFQFLFLRQLLHSLDNFSCHSLCLFRTPPYSSWDVVARDANQCFFVVSKWCPLFCSSSW